MTSTILETLTERAAGDAANAAWRPSLFDLTRDADARELGRLIDSGEIRFVHDTLHDQLCELMASRDPVRKWSREELERRVRAHLDQRPLGTYGTWAHYPWSGRLVHVLPQEEFRELRTDRNRYKITRAEQRRLSSFRIGIIGLSVGNMAAITLALEGIGGSFKIADFDQLSLSNLNRLRAGVHELGINKTVLAAREMLEIDPYLDVVRFPDGVQPETIDEFLIGGGQLDLLVEECDDLYVKVVVRERARAYRIPVIMDTSDRGLLDIERFDLEPERPILHGLIGSVRAEELLGLETKDKVPFFLAIVDEERMSARMAASLPEIKQTISTWPQLASGVALGGAITADAARRILLGEHDESGRYYLDPSAIVAAGAGALRQPLSAETTAETTPEARSDPLLPPEPRRSAEFDRDAVRWLVALGALAPSAHNAQPWRFAFHDSTLACWHDPTRDMPSLDFEGGATWLAFGAVCENLELAARHIGLKAEFALFPNADQPGLVAEVRFSPAPAQTDPLFPFIIKRVTNRKTARRARLPDAAVADITRACSAAGGRLQFLWRDDQLDEIGSLMGACDRICLLNPDIHRDAMHGYRWTRDEVEQHRDGLDVKTMELSPPDLAGLRLFRQWRVAECLARIGSGRGLEELAQKTIAGASTVGLVSVPGTGRESYFQAGRAVQRLWLTATSHGIALHPMTGLPYLFARLERGRGEGLSAREQSELADLRRRYLTLFEVRQGEAETFLFRLGTADAPSARSLRHRIDDILTFA